jgi:hypothetical protein
MMTGIIHFVFVFTPNSYKILVKCINKKTFISCICLESCIIFRRCTFSIYKVQGIEGGYVKLAASLSSCVQMFFLFYHNTEPLGKLQSNLLQLLYHEGQMNARHL